MAFSHSRIPVAAPDIAKGKAGLARSCSSHPAPPAHRFDLPFRQGAVVHGAHGRQEHGPVRAAGVTVDVVGIRHVLISGGPSRRQSWVSGSARWSASAPATWTRVGPDRPSRGTHLRGHGPGRRTVVEVLRKLIEAETNASAGTRVAADPPRGQVDREAARSGSGPTAGPQHV